MFSSCAGGSGGCSVVGYQLENSSRFDYKESNFKKWNQNVESDFNFQVNLG